MSSPQGDTFKKPHSYVLDDEGRRHMNGFAPKTIGKFKGFLGIRQKFGRSSYNHLREVQLKCLNV